MLQLSRIWKSRWLVVLLMLIGCSRNNDHGTTQPSLPRADSPAVATSNDEPTSSRPLKSIVPSKPMLPGVPATTSLEDTVAQGVARPLIPSIPSVPLKMPKGDTNDRAEEIVPMLSTGEEAPDFVSVNLAGKEVRLSDWSESIVVLDFWATWCGPCLASLPHLQEVAALCEAQGVVVLAVCTSDTRDGFEQFVAANQHKFPSIVFTCDPNERESESFAQRASRKLFGVKGLPTQFIIDRSGKVATVVVGYDKGEHRLEEALMELGIKIEPSQPADNRP